MKIISSILVMICLVSCARGEERSFTGSTPPHRLLREFLEISTSDSIDFIRWNIRFEKGGYSLHVNYGIGRPNTNGFMDGGQKISLNGSFEKQGHYLHLKNKTHLLTVLELNNDLIHFVDQGNALLVGNGAWSFTLCAEHPKIATAFPIKASASLSDSMAFEGRTPCYAFNGKKISATCLKLKWSMVLFIDAKTKEPAGCRIRGTAFRDVYAKNGQWKKVQTKDGTILFRVDSGKPDGVFYLMPVDDHILVFTDDQGKLLVGDQDFSYTLNRKW